MIIITTELLNKVLGLALLPYAVIAKLQLQLQLKLKLELSLVLILFYPTTPPPTTHHPPGQVVELQLHLQFQLLASTTISSMTSSLT